MKLTKSNGLSILKVTLYVAISAGISYLISLLTAQPDLLGVLTPVVNVVLVTLKKLFETEE